MSIRVRLAGIAPATPGVARLLEFIYRVDRIEFGARVLIGIVKAVMVPVGLHRPVPAKIELYSGAITPVQAVVGPAALAGQGSGVGLGPAPDSTHLSVHIELFSDRDIADQAQVDALGGLVAAVGRPFAQIDIGDFDADHARDFSSRENLVADVGVIAGEARRTTGVVFRFAHTTTNITVGRVGKPRARPC